MANKKKNNTTKKRKVNKNLPKMRVINTKKSEVKKTSNDEINIKSFAKIMIFLLLGFGSLYFITYFMQKAGMFDAGYTPLQSQEAVITYEDALIGTVFNRPEKEYYVLFHNFDNNSNVYLNNLINSYEGTLYEVDMSYGTNKNYVSEESNKSAQTSEKLRIKGETLIKIKNGKNVLYIEGIDNIKAQLGA